MSHFTLLFAFDIVPRRVHGCILFSVLEIDKWLVRLIQTMYSEEFGVGVGNSGPQTTYFATKTYVVGAQKNRFDEAVLLSIQNKCLN